jgi:hypothetical protein
VALDALVFMGAERLNNLAVNALIADKQEDTSFGVIYCPIQVS